MNENHITIRRVSDEEDLWYAERLYLSSFPEAERREVSDWIAYTWSKPEFRNNIIEYSGSKVGFVSFWDLGDFIYVEHFATDAAVRGKGIGGRAIETLCGAAGKPVVLEVELPEDELSRRRVVFYERHGFRLCEKKYVQPPYRAGGNELEMKIMWSNAGDIEEVFNDIVARIYGNVYGV